MGAGERVYARVTDGFEISLTNAAGNAVTHLAPGTYTIHVFDSATGHNFRLVGPGGVDLDSGAGETGNQTWTVKLVDGVYTFQCDLHPGSMWGRFTVGDVLVVARDGIGWGTVTSSPAGIDCRASCWAAFPSGSGVTLTASAAPGSTFAGWSGSDCPGTGSCCTVSVKGMTRVSAVFVKPPGTGPSPTPAATIARVSLRRVGRTLVVVALRVARHASASARLLRGGCVVASARAHLMPGEAKVRIRVPRAAPAGRYALRLTTSEDGARRTVTRSVRIGA
ncbi:MAG: DUF971 domain-containing protein [Actinomycetota bacterium]|nr:DUF971 domain-containing protein [Actinomycetota bacterium]